MRKVSPHMRPEQPFMTVAMLIKIKTFEVEIEFALCQ